MHKNNNILNYKTKIDYQSKSIIEVSHMGPRDRKERELEERRKHFLEKSKELFFTHGYHEVTIQDICDAVEYGRSAVYSLFESKEEIYSYIYLDAMKIIADLNTSINPDSDDFDGEMIKCAENLFMFYSDYTDYYKALSYFNTNAVAHSKIPPKIMEEKERLLEQAGMPAAALMARHIQKGYIKEFTIPDFIQLFFSSIIGIINHFIYTEDENDKDKIHQFIMLHTRLYLDGLKK